MCLECLTYYPIELLIDEDKIVISNAASGLSPFNFQVSTIMYLHEATRVASWRYIIVEIWKLNIIGN